jgi:hypothetical protein
MSETKFIPGPWEACWEDGKHGVIAEAAEKKLVCVIGNRDDGKNDTRKANAHLIATAPTMYEKLEEAAETFLFLRQHLEGRMAEGALDRLDELGSDILELLTKARGEQPK